MERKKGFERYFKVEIPLPSNRVLYLDLSDGKNSQSLHLRYAFFLVGKSYSI